MFSDFFDNGGCLKCKFAGGDENQHCEDELR